MKYIVVSAAKKVAVISELTKFLENEVNIKIAEGWRPIGGIAVDNFGLYQAMILEE
jgi:hypothetical protein